MEQKEGQFHDQLKRKMDFFVHFVYRLTRTFPREELFGVVSQLRRAALSIILNYIEGYARQSEKSYVHFLDISYGSLKETKYLLHFFYVEQYIDKGDYQEAKKYAEEIGAMLWSTIKVKRS